MKIIKINQFVSGFLIMIFFLLLTKTVLSKENQFECKVKDFKTSDIDKDFIIKNIRKQFLITTTQTSFYLTQISNDYKNSQKIYKISKRWDHLLVIYKIDPYVSEIISFNELKAEGTIVIKSNSFVNFWILKCIKN
jgi:hypothetical protein